MSYQELCKTAEYMGLQVEELPLRVSDGLTFGRTIAIRSYIESDAKKRCVLAEELGHCLTTVGDILDGYTLDARKQELQARRWAHALLLPAKELYDAQQAGCIELWETAEYLGVTEDFLMEALENYKLIYGSEAYIDGYHVRFDPLHISQQSKKILCAPTQRMM